MRAVLPRAAFIAADGASAGRIRRIRSVAAYCLASCRNLSQTGAVKTARYWHKRDDGAVQCELCPHGCAIGEGRVGICGARGMQAGELRALTYGSVSSAHADPIEKKPLHHFHPGATIFSIGSWGCNFRCPFCQNWSISQEITLGAQRVSPEQIADAGAGHGSIGIAYTYNEPLIGAEFVLDCARLARERGLANVLVTNGYVMPGPAAELLPYIDALNIDIKSMDEGFYREQCGGRLQPVLDFCVQAVRAGCHVEITNLVIPGLNDSAGAIRALAEWVASNLGPNTPLHLSAYHPQFKATAPATPPRTLADAHVVCRRILTYVYVGNVRLLEGQDTLCPGCGATQIRRLGYTTEVTGLRDGRCAACGRAADVVL